MQRLLKRLSIPENTGLLLSGVTCLVYGLVCVVIRNVHTAAVFLLLGSTTIIWVRYRINRAESKKVE